MTDEVDIKTNDPARTAGPAANEPVVASPDDTAAANMLRCHDGSGMPWPAWLAKRTHACELTEDAC